MAESRIERETVVLWNDEEPDAIINTRSPTTVRRLTRKGYVFNEMPPDSGLFRASIPKRLCIPKAVRPGRPSKGGSQEENGHCGAAVEAASEGGA